MTIPIAVLACATDTKSACCKGTFYELPKLTVPWTEQRTVVERVDLSPVQGETSEGKSERDSSRLPEELVNQNIVWLDPCHPGEVAEGGDDEVWEP